jgi:hypothetical protein
MESHEVTGRYSVKDRAEEINKNPDLLILLLLRNDPILRNFYKRRKKNSLKNRDLSLTDRLSLMKESPFVQLNRELWSSFKQYLLNVKEDEKDSFLAYSGEDGQTAPEKEGSFFLWLLTEAGLSPHHTRQMLRYYLKSLELLGKFLREWTVDDAIYLMILRLKKRQGGSREIFELARLYWLYSSDQEKLDKLISRVMDFTGISE